MRALLAEWTKVRTLPGNVWAILGVAVTTIGAGAAMSLRDPAAADGTRTALSGVYIGQNVVVVFAVLAVTNEYATGMVRTSVMAVPRRSRLLAARLAVVAGSVLVAGAVGVSGSLLAGARAVGDAATVRAALGTVAYLVLLALFSVGAGLALRDAAAGVSAVLGALYLLPIVAAQVPDVDLRDDLLQFAPMTAGLAVQATRDLSALPVRPLPGLALFGAYAAATLLAGCARFEARDA